MPRFIDEWVIDRVLIDYVSGGACACCGLQHLFLPNGTADLITAISDLETDQQTQEVAALEFHPWPVGLRDQVWADRVRLRQKLKLDKKRYQLLWLKDNGSENSNKRQRRQAFLDWCWRPSTQEQLKRWFQLSRTEIMETIQQRYNIHSAFGVVLCAVVDQVAGFHLTEYPPDGRGKYEVQFEKALVYDRRGGFTLPFDNDNQNQREATLTMWLEHMEHTVGSPGKQLLVRKESASNDGDPSEQQVNDVDDAVAAQGSIDPDGPEQKRSTAKTSFASDRRLVRLIISRHWAELLEAKFKQFEKEAENDELDDSKGQEALPSS